MEFFAQYESYSSFQILLELVATILGISSVVFFIYKNILGYPTGIISTIIYVYLLFGWGLYGDMLINFYYTIMSIYGWYFWWKMKDEKDEIVISKMNKQDYVYTFFIFVFTFIFVLLVYYLKNNYIEPIQTELLFNYRKIDFVDIFTTSLFFVGMYLMAKVKLEQWIFWIVGDFVSIFLYHKKGYDVTAIQYTVFFVLAVVGFYQWFDAHQKQKIECVE
ncbi:MAG: nicotinamide mononucleotide transporter [Flavobacteriales bacterium]|nr:nicotinamide mononucleotide transporter [Flavobacteriales bacterium]